MTEHTATDRAPSPHATVEHVLIKDFVSAQATPTPAPAQAPAARRSRISLPALSTIIALPCAAAVLAPTLGYLSLPQLQTGTTLNLALSAAALLLLTLYYLCPKKGFTLRRTIALLLALPLLLSPVVTARLLFLNEPLLDLLPALTQAFMLCYALYLLGALGAATLAQLKCPRLIALLCKLCAALLYLLPALLPLSYLAAYALSGTLLSTDALLAVLQTNAGESMAYLREHYDPLPLTALYLCLAFYLCSLLVQLCLPGKSQLKASAQLKTQESA